MENWVQRYPEGADVRISYYPGDPRTSVIAPEQ